MIAALMAGPAFRLPMALDVGCQSFGILTFLQHASMWHQQTHTKSTLILFGICILT